MDASKRSREEYWKNYSGSKNTTSDL